MVCMAGSFEPDTTKAAPLAAIRSFAHLSKFWVSTATPDIAFPPKAAATLLYNAMATAPSCEGFIIPL